MFSLVWYLRMRIGCGTGRSPTRVPFVSRLEVPAPEVASARTVIRGSFCFQLRTYVWVGRGDKISLKFTLHVDTHSHNIIITVLCTHTLCTTMHTLGMNFCNLKVKILKRVNFLCSICWSLNYVCSMFWG